MFGNGVNLINDAGWIFGQWQWKGEIWNCIWASINIFLLICMLLLRERRRTDDLLPTCSVFRLLWGSEDSEVEGRGLSPPWRPMLSVVCPSDISSCVVSWHGVFVMCRTAGPVSRHDWTSQGNTWLRLNSGALVRCGVAFRHLSHGQSSGRCIAS